MTRAAGSTTANECIKIPSEYHCKQFQADKCIVCNDQITLQTNGTCSLKLDYNIGLCAKHNLNGSISSLDFKCDFCQSGSVPVDLDNYFVCTSKENYTSVPKNCLKWALDDRTKNYYCALCSDGNYLFDGSCYDTCPLDSGQNAGKVKVV